MARPAQNSTTSKRPPRIEVFPPTLADRIIEGNEVSLYSASQRAGSWEEHQRPQVEVALFFTPALVRIGWIDASEWKERELCGPHVCVIAAGVPHRCHLESDAELLVLYVEDSLIRRVLKRSLSGVLFGEAAHHDLVIWFLASALRELCAEPGPRDAWMVDGLAARLVQRLIKRCGDQRPPMQQTGAALATASLEKVLRYMQANMKHDIHVVDLAKQVGLSVPHFSELFKNKTQLSPYHYLKEVRMMKAYQMILKGDHNLREVALAVGYTNTDHFSEVFRKTFREPARVLLARARQRP